MTVARRDDYVPIQPKRPRIYPRLVTALESQQPPTDREKLLIVRQNPSSEFLPRGAEIRAKIRRLGPDFRLELGEVEIVAEDNRAKFEFLRHEWEAETVMMSSVDDIIKNENYLRIIGIGPPAVTLILDEVRRSRSLGHWHWALRSITCQDPVPEKHYGDFVAMRSDWLTWAEANGYAESVAADQV